MIISTGGGSKSDLWSQMKADITGLDIAIPENEEAACLGAAIIGAVDGRDFASYKEAAGHCVSLRKIFKPGQNKLIDNKRLLFDDLYKAVTPLFKRTDV